MDPRERLAFALDVPTRAEAARWVARLAPHVGVFKVGLELFVAEGPDVVRLVHDAGGACFLDLKLHDIPATVARATARAVALGARYLTVHAANGRSGLAEARKAAEGSATELLAVTVLTSQRASDLTDLGVGRSMADQVTALAQLAMEAGAHGLVCSAEECARVRGVVGQAATLAVPGIRPEGSSPGDQARVATPADALRSGASVLVVGRPIRDASAPEAVVATILEDIARWGAAG